MPTFLQTYLWRKLLGIAFLAVLLSATLVAFWPSRTHADSPGNTHAAATVYFAEDALSEVDDGLSVAGTNIRLNVTFRGFVRQTRNAHVWVRVVHGPYHVDVSGWIYAGACEVQSNNTLNRSCSLSVSPRVSEVGEYFLHWWVGDATGRHPWSYRFASTQLRLLIIPSFELDIASDFDCPDESEGGALDAIFDLGRAAWRGLKKQDLDLCDLINLNDTEAAVYSVSGAVSDVSGVGDIVDAQRCNSEGCSIEERLIVAAGFIPGAGDASKAWRKYRTLRRSADEITLSRTAKAGRFATAAKIKTTKMYEEAKLPAKARLEVLANRIRQNCRSGRTLSNSCLRDLGELQAAFDLHDLGYRLEQGQISIPTGGVTATGRPSHRRVDWVVKDHKGQSCLVEARSRTNSGDDYAASLVASANREKYKCAMLHIRPTASRSITDIGGAFSGPLSFATIVKRWGETQGRAIRTNNPVEFTVVGRQGSQITQVKLKR